MEGKMEGKMDEKEKAQDQHRQAMVANKPLAYKEHNFAEEGEFDIDLEDEDTELIMNDNKFEFTESYHIMRFIRMLLILQVLGMMIENPAMKVSTLFTIVSRFPLFYSIRFYSRPFLDLIYAVQYFASTLNDLGSGDGGRRLTNTTSTDDTSNTIFINMLDEEQWHGAKIFSHYFLGILFSIMPILFFLRQWEITDYTNRNEVRAWLKTYIADGWWRRGGLHVALDMARGYGLMALIVIFFFLCSQQFSFNNPPSNKVITGVVFLGMSVVFIIWIIGFIFIRLTENAFIRYVSQNVSYTSQIILKRAMKAKMELGLALVLCMYMPVIFNLTEALIAVMDWNDFHAVDFRKSTNYYVPCYFSAFPPFRKQFLDQGTCPVEKYSVPDMVPRTKGMYNDITMLPCDSYAGILFFLMSSVTLLWLVIGYWYFFTKLVSLGATEFRESKFVDILEKLLRIRDSEVKDFKDRFPWHITLRITVKAFLWNMIQRIYDIGAWIVLVPVTLVMNLLSAIYYITMPIWYPFYYLIKTIITISCLSFLTKEGREREAIRKGQRLRKQRERKHGIQFQPDGDNQGDAHDNDNDNDNNSVDTASSWEASPVLCCCRQVYRCYRSSLKLPRAVMNSIMTSNHMVAFRVGVNSTLNSLRCWEKNAEMSGGVSDLGGQMAPWRAERTLHAKFNLIKRMKEHIGTELYLSKKNFIVEHELFICMDHTLDSAGVFLLNNSYNYTKLYWFLVVLFELTIYGFIAGILNALVTWQTRNIFFALVATVFGVITCIFDPYVIGVDKWLDVAGRVLVVLVSLGLIVCADLNPKAQSESDTIMYEPIANLKYVFESIGKATSMDMYSMIDVTMVLYMYIYILYILSNIGFFGVFRRAFYKVVYSMHDSIMDFLTEVLDDHVFGMEDIFRGLQMVQQWDEVIAMQRRYAFLNWPLFRPADLLSTTAKITTVKWAAVFNLTVKNLRTSLGLTIMHIMMFSGATEVTRWLMYMYPEMLLVKDSQNDTPVTIALKECAHFLCAYGQQNGGALDDGTGYSDESYNYYYPEVEQLRDQVYQHGEFEELKALTTSITAADEIRLKDEGVYEEPPPWKKKALLSPVKTDIYGNKKYNPEQFAEIKIERTENNRLRRVAEQNKDEKASVFQNRFPEDELHDDIDGGLLPAWGVIGHTVPQENLFFDKEILKKMQKDSDYRCYDMKNEEILFTPIDMRRIVPTARAMPIEIKAKFAVPFAHAEIKTFCADWDTNVRKKKKKKKMSKTPVDEETGLTNSDSDSESSKSSTGGDSDTESMMSGSVYSGMSGGSGDMGEDILAAKAAKLARRKKKSLTKKQEQEIRFKICKYAEILLSKEIVDICSKVQWQLADYKDFQRLANPQQGRAIQNLAMVCNLNAPPGFTRLSDWHRGDLPVTFAIDSTITVSRFMTRAAKVVQAVEDVSAGVMSIINKMKMRKGESLAQARMRVNTRKVERDEDGEIITSDDVPLGGVEFANHTAFSDRCINYLSEALVCNRDRVCLEDSELSHNGRFSWRAIARVMRRKNCTFIVPSTFISPRPVLVRYLELGRNDLDCGDMVYLTDIIINQPLLEYLDVRFNRIGGRGMTRLTRGLREHKNIRTFRADHNMIGPGAGKDIGIWLKACSSIKVVSLSHNRMGELVRYPNLLSRQRMASAIGDISFGIKMNRSLEILDLSYNHLGPDCAKYLPVAVLKNRTLHTLNLSGNYIGAKKGPALIFGLGGNPKGMKETLQRIKFVNTVKYKHTTKGPGPLSDKDLFEIMNGSAGGEGEEEKSGKKSDANKPPVNETTGGNGKATTLTSLSLADNMLEAMSGYALANLLDKSKSLTHLDISGNALGFEGGEAFADQLELCYSIVPRDFVKHTVWEIDERKYHGRNAIKRKKVYTNLLSLNMSRNGLGPTVVASLMFSLGSPKNTIIDIDVSHNPLGLSSQKGGSPYDAAVDIRYGLANCKTLTHLQLSQTAFSGVEMVTYFGGMADCKTLLRLQLQGFHFDDPSCLQLCTALDRCNQINYLDLKNCKMAVQGAIMVANKVLEACHRITYLDMTGCKMGPLACVYIANAMKHPDSVTNTLRLAGNDLMDAGGGYLTRSLIGNVTVTDLDLSNNFLGEQAATFLTDFTRGLFKNGKKVTSCCLRRLLINDNPKIGAKLSKTLVRALAGDVEHIELRNIGAMPGTAHLIAIALRNPAVAWQYIDMSNNEFSRGGLNEIFWAMRHNKRVRVLKLGDSKAGPVFGSDEDKLLNHGIALSVTILHNFVLRDLDLSYNGLSSEAGSNILDAIIDNHTLKRLSMRGNVLDDKFAFILPDFFRCNNVLEELDLGENRMAYACGFAIAESLETNRGLKTLLLDYNQLGAAGSATIDAFSRSMVMNYTLEVLDLDGNKLGPDWGQKLAQVIARNNTLNQLSLRDNRFDSRAGMALLSAYKNCPYLIELAISGDEVGQLCWELFRKEFERKRNAAHPDDIRDRTSLQPKENKLLAKYSLSSSS